MTPNEQLFDRLKEWHPKELEVFAAKLLVLAQPGYHGSKTIHYAAGCPRKVVDTVTRDI
jgi:hypothetical protein